MADLNTEIEDRFSDPEQMKAGLDLSTNKEIPLSEKKEQKTEEIQDAEQPSESDDITENEEVVNEEEIEEEPKKETSAIKKIREAEKRAKKKAEELERKNKELQEKLAKWEKEGNNPKQGKQDNELGEKPNPNDYTEMDKYIDDLSAYNAKKAALETAKFYEEKIKKEKEEKRQQEVHNEWQKKVKEAKKRYKDYDEALEEADENDLKLDQHVIDIITDPDNKYGADILYHLSKNPELASELNELSPSQALRKLAKLEVQIEEARKPKPAKVTNAPAPATPLKAITGSTEKSIEQLLEDGDMEAIRAWQKKNPGKPW